MRGKLTRAAVAYRKGAAAAASKSHRGRKACPYGETRRNLVSWWLGGFSDYELGFCDENGVATIDTGESKR